MFKQETSVTGVDGPVRKKITHGLEHLDFAARQPEVFTQPSLTQKTSILFFKKTRKFYKAQASECFKQCVDLFLSSNHTL